MCFNSKKNKIALLLIIVTFLFFNRVDAASCTNTIKRELVKEAEKVEIVPYLNEEYNPMHVYKYNVYITNLSENIFIIDSIGNRYEYDEFQDENSVFGMYAPGSKITFAIYASINTECNNAKLTSLTINFDYYNDYSTREECKGIEEFSLCKRNYNGKIESDEWFKQKVEEYKNGNHDVEIEEESEEETNKIKDIIFHPITITIFSLLLIGVIVLIIYKLRKNKGKVKIKYKDIKERGEEYEENK